MGLINKLNDQDYIVTDSDGEICGIGKKVSSFMHIGPLDLLKNRLNI
jgi:hypothetical protein